MALEFKLKDEDNGSELFIHAQGFAGNRTMRFMMCDKDGNQHDFGIIHQEELIEFALFINQKIGFSLCSTYDIEKIIEKDKKTLTELPII